MGNHHFMEGGKMKIKLCILIISVMFLLGLLPFGAFAEEVVDGPSKKLPDPKEEIVDMQKEAEKAESVEMKKELEPPTAEQKESEEMEPVQTKSDAMTPEPEKSKDTEVSQPESQGKESAKKKNEVKESIEKIKANIQARNNKEKIYFAVKSDTLDESAKKILDEMAAWLEAHPDANLIIEGHGNEYNNRERDLRLGDLRAGSVLSYLISKGINPRRLTAVSYGAERSRNPKVARQYHVKNWRVCFLVKQQGGE